MKIIEYFKKLREDPWRWFNFEADLLMVAFALLGVIACLAFLSLLPGCAMVERNCLQANSNSACKVL